jgi:GNAT superfamily N-acetyltransferase
VWRKLRLQALEEASYAFTSRLADWQGQGDAEARWRGRLSDVPFNMLADWQNTAAGMASGTALSPDGSIELISMRVTPLPGGRGVGASLVNAVFEWAREQGASRVPLGVLEGNERAAAFYRRYGFIPVRPTGGIVGERRIARDLPVFC